MVVTLQGGEQGREKTGEPGFVKDLLIAVDGISFRVGNMSRKFIDVGKLLDTHEHQDGVLC